MWGLYSFRHRGITLSRGNPFLFGGGVCCISRNPTTKGVSERHGSWGVRLPASKLIQRPAQSGLGFLALLEIPPQQFRRCSHGVGVPPIPPYPTSICSEAWDPMFPGCSTTAHVGWFVGCRLGVGWAVGWQLGGSWFCTRVQAGLASGCFPKRPTDRLHACRPEIGTGRMLEKYRKR